MIFRYIIKIGPDWLVEFYEVIVVGEKKTCQLVSSLLARLLY